MVEYKVGIDSMNWPSLMELYTATDGVIGLARKQEHQKIQRAFAGSFKIVSAWDGTKIVGCARLISDGICYGWVHDVAVHPDYRLRQIGSRLMEVLLEGHDGILIGLTSSFEAVDFYKAIGFKKHKTGMARYPGNSIYLED